MGVPHIIVRNSENFKGIDKRSSDLKRTMEYATDVKNAAFRVSGAINKRKGFHSHILGPSTASEGAYGTFTYRVADSTTGAITEKVLMVNEKLQEVKECLFTITNNRTAITNPNEDTTVLVSHYLDKGTNQFIFKVTDVANINTYFSSNLGTGKSINDINIADLKTAIEADPTLNISINITDASGSTLSPVPSVPAAFLDILTETSIQSTATQDISFRLLEEKVRDNGDSTTTSNLFTAFDHVSSGYVTTDLLENISAAQLNNVMYFSNGQDPVMKYDGTNIYRAGLPGLVETVIPGSWAYEIDVEQSGTTTASINTIVLHEADGGGNNQSGFTYYKFVIEYTDAQGNLVQSQPSDPIKWTFGANHDHVGISWDDSIFAGLNKNSNLKVQIYKTIIGAPTTTGLFYHVGTVAWDNSVTITLPDASTLDVNFEDTTEITTGTTEGLEFLSDPVKRRDPPPKGRYLTTFQNCLIISGQNENVNNLQYSHPGGGTIGEIGSEYFPDDDNGTIVESSFGDRITAIATLRDLLYIFHRNSIHVLGGDITSSQGAPYSVELLTKEGGIGCTSFASIVEFRSQLLFLSEAGMYSIDSTNALSEISALVKPFFQDKKLVKKRAVSFNWNDQNLILLHIPKEAVPPTGVEALVSTEDSLILAYDTYKDAWLKWEGVNFSGGIVATNDRVLFSSRELNPGSYPSFTVSSFSETGSTYDFSDHEKAIEFEYETNWESLKDPTVPKKFLRVKLYAMDTDNSFESPGFDLDVAVQKDFFNFDVGTIPFDFGGGREEVGWGADPWGTYPWGGPPNQFFKSKLPAGKSRCVKLKFSNSSLLENVLITNYELEIAAPFAQEIKE